MRHPMMSVLEQNPVLPAVKDAGRLEACLAQPAGVVFLLCGDILNIDRLIDRVHQAGYTPWSTPIWWRGWPPVKLPWTSCTAVGPTASSPPAPCCCAVAGSWVC